MILAQRAPVAGSYDYSSFTRPDEPRVLRFWLESPDDPTTPSRWNAAVEEYAVGFAGNYRNSNGGVDLGYGYTASPLDIPLHPNFGILAQRCRGLLRQANQGGD